MVTLDAVLDLLADKVAERLRSQITPQPVKLLTVVQVGDMIGRSKSAVQHLIAAGEIPAVKVGRRVHVEVEEIQKWIERNRG